MINNECHLKQYSLALHTNADIILIDDRKAYNEAMDKKLNPVSTRAVLIFAEERGAIDNYRELEKDLRKKSFFLPGY